MRLFLAVLMTWVVASCTSIPNDSEHETEREYVTVDIPEHGAHRFEIARDREVVSSWLPLDPPAVWRYLLPTYGYLGFEAGQLSTYDAGGHQIAVSGQRVRTLADRPLSEFLQCGYSLTTPKADQGQVRVSLATWLEPAEDGTVVHTRLSGTARDRGSSSAVTRCTSLGTLERLILEQIVVRASPSSPEE